MVSKSVIEDPRTTGQGPRTFDHMDTFSTGDGELFSDPSANHARAYFATKPRALTDKIATVPEAVARLAHDGEYPAGGAVGCHRIPTAVAHDILRQGRQVLRCAGHTATH